MHQGGHRRILLSNKGLPLNPHGRTGMAGRGSYLRFGPNTIYFYAILQKVNNETKVRLFAGPNCERHTFYADVVTTRSRRL